MAVLASSHPALSLPSQLEELGARKRDTDPMGAEVHEHGDFALEIDNATKAVLVVRHQITPLVYLGGLLDDWNIEGTTWQVPSARTGARWFHFIHSTRKAWLVTAMAAFTIQLIYAATPAGACHVALRADCDVAPSLHR